MANMRETVSKATQLSRISWARMGLISNSIEIGTAVIDMLYESSLYMAEDAGAADLIAGRGALPRNRISEET
jgi:hypothetical protein